MTMGDGVLFDDTFQGSHPSKGLQTQQQTLRTSCSHRIPNTHPSRITNSTRKHQERQWASLPNINNITITIITGYRLMLPSQRRAIRMM